MLTAVLSNSTKLMACVYHVVWWSCACFVFWVEVHFRCGIHLHVRYSMGAHLSSSRLQPSVCLWCTSTVRRTMTGSYCSGGDMCRYLAMVVVTRQMLISANDRKAFLTFCNWMLDINLHFVGFFISNSRQDFISSMFSKRIRPFELWCSVVWWTGNRASKGLPIRIFKKRDLKVLHTLFFRIKSQPLHLPSKKTAEVCCH